MANDPQHQDNHGRTPANWTGATIIMVTHEKKDISFKENIVKKGKATVGSLHRYSFDVRA